MAPPPAHPLAGGSLYGRKGFAVASGRARGAPRRWDRPGAERLIHPAVRARAAGNVSPAPSVHSFITEDARGHLKRHLLSITAPGRPPPPPPPLPNPPPLP